MAEMEEQVETAEVVVVGAGPAGSAVASLLAGRGWDVLLLDRATFPRAKTCGDGLTPRAVAALQRLGLLPALASGPSRIIQGARLVAPDGSDWHLRFGDHSLGLPPFGLTIPRAELDDLLRRHAMAQGARFRDGVRVTGPLWRAGRVAGVEGEAREGPVAARARLVILATGAQIGLLRAFGLLNQMPAGINAIRGYFAGVPELGDEFEFYFDRQLTPGYGWVFPLADGRANIGLGVLARNGGAVPNLRHELAAFLDRHPRLRAAQPLDLPRGYPLRTDFPRCRPAGPGFLLVGEALGLVNPVTGEGIDLALESAQLAAEVADAALQRGEGGAGILRLYGWRLWRRYGGLFRGLRLLLRLATSPRALSILIHRARQRPYLARLIAGINLGVISPWLAFAPRTWWDILRR